MPSETWVETVTILFHLQQSLLESQEKTDITLVWPPHGSDSNSLHNLALKRAKPPFNDSTVTSLSSFHINPDLPHYGKNEILLIEAMEIN